MANQIPDSHIVTNARFREMQRFLYTMQLSHLGKLTSLQNKAIQAVNSAEWNESSSPPYNKLKELKIYDTYKYELAKFMPFVQNKTLPTTLINFLTM